MKLKSALSTYNYLPVYLFLLIILNLIFINLPLAHVFGFEFSVLNSLVLTVFSGLYTISLLRKWIGNENAQKEIYTRMRIAFPLFLITPAAVSVINTIFGKSCSLIDGMAFYTVITIPAVLIGTTLAGISYLISRRAPWVIFIVFLLLIALIPFLEFYFNPQIYFYNPLIGYFPGTIYDEGLSVEGRLVLYRFFNLLYFSSVLTLLYLHFFKGRKVRRLHILLYAILISALFIYISPCFRFSTTQGELKKELSENIETKHFSIYYSPQINKRLIKVIALHHEYYYGELVKFFNQTPREKFTSYIFASADQKGVLFGSSNADVAKPWLMQTYTTYDNYNTTLRHEIAHCFTAEFGKGIFKIADNFNPALIEGAATAANPLYDENYIHSMAALAYKNGYKVRLEELFNSLNFFRQNSSLSYIYAGSFSDYLIRTYGIQKFKKLYTDIDFPAIYGRTASVLVKDYYRFLDSFESISSKDEATYYFSRKAIIQKVCPRYVSDRLKIAWHLIDRKKYTEAQMIFKEVLEVTNEYSALLGLVACLTEMDEQKNSVQLILKNLEFYKNTSYYYNIEFKLADLFGRLDMKDKADSLYRKIEEQNPNRSLLYLSGLRRALITEGDNLNMYLKGSDYDKYSILKKLNAKAYSYASFPVLIDLSRELNEDYLLFKKQFDKTFFVTGFESSYALYRLSQYMLECGDFTGAMRIAAFAARFKGDDNFNFVLENNFRKAEWFYRNGDKMYDALSRIPD